MTEKQKNFMCRMAKEICNECYDCKFYWQNTDDGNECNGDTKPCHEYIDLKESEQK